ncbi:MAG: hypothetical protein Greene101415_324 [Parcubacteria group bacterium Greene1014_15]|nr:MAG: hypothetical protein Greene101415_324 [Parcubacteria group bacterium Greene1014_15]
MILSNWCLEVSEGKPNYWMEEILPRVPEYKEGLPEWVHAVRGLLFRMPPDRIDRFHEGDRVEVASAIFALEQGWWDDLFFWEEIRHFLDSRVIIDWGYGYELLPIPDSARFLPGSIHV